MASYSGNIEELTLNNGNFRQVLFTGQYTQLVVMSLLPNEEIGMEAHPNVDQFFRFESGQGKVIIDGVETIVADGMAVIVPAGSQHNIINTGAQPLKLYTLYSPPNHPDGTVHATKAEADAAEESHHSEAGATDPTIQSAIPVTNPVTAETIVPETNPVMGTAIPTAGSTAGTGLPPADPLAKKPQF